jgi:hypothetical protein
MRGSRDLLTDALHVIARVKNAAAHPRHLTRPHAPLFRSRRIGVSAGPYSGVGGTGAPVSDKSKPPSFSSPSSSRSSSGSQPDPVIASTVLAHQRRRRPAPLLDARGDRGDLGIRVGPGIFRIRDQPIDRPPLDLVGRPRLLISPIPPRAGARAAREGKCWRFYPSTR